MDERWSQNGIKNKRIKTNNSDTYINTEKVSPQLINLSQISSSGNEKDKNFEHMLSTEVFLSDLVSIYSTLRFYFLLNLGKHC